MVVTASIIPASFPADQAGPLGSPAAEDSPPSQHPPLHRWCGGKHCSTNRLRGGGGAQYDQFKVHELPVLTDISTALTYDQSLKAGL